MTRSTRFKLLAIVALLALLAATYWLLHETGALFARLGITPFSLSFKEGIALMNGTSAMTAVAAFALFAVFCSGLVRFGFFTGL